jgi:hypothetical protein
MAKVLAVGGSDTAHRFLTEPKMQSVWRTLLRAKVASLDGLESWQRLSDYDTGATYTLKEEACAAFFASAAVRLDRHQRVRGRACTHKLSLMD